jgi:DNA processing protein
MSTTSPLTSGDDHRMAWLTLKLIPGLGNRSILRLIRHFGSPEAVLQASPAALARVPGLRPQAVAALQHKRPVRDPHHESGILQQHGMRLLCLDDPDYPVNLTAIPDPPAVLFMQGDLQPRDLVAVAVVGSRAASAMGMTFTKRLCADLAQQGVTIVSGLAVGIDSAAHQGAVQAQGRTLAVLGCGLDIEYPQSNRKLRGQIVAAGALLTEFPLGTPPEPAHFPARNRIISGLALGVVVVEAAHRSGSLITARLALEQGREVFAVPGLARHYRSVGPHQLLRQGAKLVETAQDILEEISPMIRTRRDKAEDPTVRPQDNNHAAEGYAPEETALLDLLDRAPVHIDELCRHLQWPVAQVATLLLALELKGAVQQLPGKYFTRSFDSW